LSPGLTAFVVGINRDLTDTMAQPCRIRLSGLVVRGASWPTRCHRSGAGRGLATRPLGTRGRRRNAASEWRDLGVSA
jgi:hypothetical protein